MRATKWIGGRPAAIPKLGTILDVSPNSWQPNPFQQPLRIRIEQIHLEASRRYNGTRVWVEGLVQIGNAPGIYRQALLRVKAIPPECRDPYYQPPSVYTVDPSELRPGNLVRVGRPASGKLRHTFAMRITLVGERQLDGRIPLTGYHVTYTGHVVQRVTVCASLDDLHPIHID